MRMQNQQLRIEDPGFAPSFSCYSSDTTTSKAVAKAIREEKVARYHQNNGEDFEFALGLSEEQGWVKETYLQGSTIFKRDLLVNDPKIAGPLEKVFIEELEDSSWYSSSEETADEYLKSLTSSRTKCKKSNSIRCGLKRWIFWYLLHRSNNDDKEPIVLLTPKQKQDSGEVSKVNGWWKVHEKFYVQKRAENEVAKRRSYLPYRKDLVGLFANFNGIWGKSKCFRSN